MIPTNDLQILAKYQTIRAFRPDGSVLIATRKVEDGKPIYWDVDENDPSPFKPPVLNWKGPYSTSQLIKIAKEKGYGSWYPAPEDAEPDENDYLFD
jgi:hypothetical protein